MKEKEILSNKNKKFLDLLKNPNSIIESFKGKTRFEMELDSSKKICKFLDINSSHINYIFSSDVNPLLTQFNRVFGEDEIENKYSITNYEDYAMSAIIEKHNGDIKIIEQEIKDLNLYSKKSRKSLSNRMEKIKRLIEQRNDRLYCSNDILTEIRERLSH